jgi:tRNA(fMet)-specific endonuclease VapC
MEPRFLLDTNICIYIRRRKPLELFERFQALRAGEAAISMITFGELFYGASKSREYEANRARLDELIQILPVLPLPTRAAEVYGAVRADLESRGQTIGNNDLWIAAHAITSNLILVTNNEREFKRVRKLQVQNWAV